MAVLAGQPIESVEPPEAVHRIAAGAAVRVVWRNVLGGLTFELGRGQSQLFVKWAPRGSGLDLAAEAARMEWARRYTPVPRPVEQGADGEGNWLVTEAISGESAVLGHWKLRPDKAVTAVGQGLRALHDALPVEDCPFSWSAEDRLSDAWERAAQGQIDPANWHEEHRHLRVAEALDLLAGVPPVDRSVVCHGDACCPNTLLGPDGRWVAHVDLGQLGTADRWADLAVASWSTTWNYGPDWESALLDAYGIEPDHERTYYYRLMWDLGP